MYGSGEEGGLGPFSVKLYLQHMVKNGSWGDNIMLGLIASMWGVRISILLADSCAEVCIRHDSDWPEVDFGLLFNCNMATGHYSGVKCNDDLGVECKAIKEGDNYSREEDNKSELTVPLGMVVVSVERLKELLKDHELAKKVRQLVKEEKGSGGGTGGVIGGDKRKKKGEDTADEAEIDKDVQNVKKGDVHCIRCNKDFPSTAQLKKHVQIYHKNVYSHICNLCDKGFHSMEGLREHQKVHKGSLFKCEKCTKTFTMARAKKRHLRDIHGKKINLKCQHCGHVSHTHCTLYLHLKSCPQNPNRVPLYCDLCPKGPWYTGSKLLAHKWKDHKWK